MQGPFIIGSNKKREMLEFMMVMGEETRKRKALELEEEKLKATIPLLQEQTKSQKIANEQAPQRLGMEQKRLGFEEKRLGIEQEQLKIQQRDQTMQELRSSSYIKSVDAQTALTMTNKDWQDYQLNVERAMEADKKKFQQYQMRGETARMERMIPVWNKLSDEEVKQTVLAGSELKYYQAAMEAMGQQLSLYRTLEQQRQFEAGQFSSALANAMGTELTTASRAEIGQMALTDSSTPAGRQRVMARVKELGEIDSSNAMALKGAYPPAQAFLNQYPGSTWAKDSQARYMADQAAMPITGMPPSPPRGVHTGTWGTLTWMDEMEAKERGGRIYKDWLSSTARGPSPGPRNQAQQNSAIQDRTKQVLEEENAALRDYNDIMNDMIKSFKLPEPSGSRR